ncbi:spore coat protein U domain-containing protein [Pseudomonas typographi]|uniref:Fimbrial major subunit CsuA/B family protein n=2 Tax=Pseudomonas typographi TaxID=2715964 RepID=A0ABR7YYA1_9PSED|nr:spore coat protein U domain-containing protein [Pseudomonas typographi]MBD1550415.1 fimbrial major subunit CsuA/B family protein [Pseudomonas typographi]MBD1598116.1 fimbrial major subunit CsuA/B family protein [Pseudomonas typographi]
MLLLAGLTAPLQAATNAPIQLSATVTAGCLVVRGTNDFGTLNFGNYSALAIATVTVQQVGISLQCTPGVTMNLTVVSRSPAQPSAFYDGTTGVRHLLKARRSFGQESNDGCTGLGEALARLAVTDAAKWLKPDRDNAWLRSSRCTASFADQPG